MNQWTHLAASFDTAYLKLFTNGVLAHSAAFSYALGDSSCDWGIGGWTSACAYSGQYFPSGGQIDEVTLYSRALQDGEISAIYQAGAAGKCKGPPPCAPCPAGAVASWPGEGDASDMFNNNHPGTLQNGVSFAQGMVARGFSFNPTNQQAVEMPPIPGLCASPFSLEAWIKPVALASGSPGQTFLFGESYCGQLIARNGLQGVRVAFDIASNRWIFQEVLAPNDLPLGQWSHVVGVYAGSVMSLYVNGGLVQQAPVTLTPYDAGCPWHLGGIYDPSAGGCAYVGQFFNGLIDEATVYARALTAGEVQALYNAGGAGKCGSLGAWLQHYFGPDCWNKPYATASADADSDGTNNFQAYLLDTDPNKIRFSLSLTNLYVTNTAVPVQLNIAGGVPFYCAVLINITNAANTNWPPYVAANLNVNLGPADGFYEVWVGLKGLPADAQQTWQWNRFKLDRTPPQLVITSPSNGTVGVPLLQLTGYSMEALSGLTYSINNAAGTTTGQQAEIIGQLYSTNTSEFTTNFFQCYDVPLTTGLNAITLQAVDLAGNMTTLTTNIVCLPTSNPPAVTLTWPQDGMQISGGSVTIQGQVSDPTATVSVAVVDGSGNTNYYSGLAGRDGIFWVENVALNTPTNRLALTLSNAAGGTTTNFTLLQSSIGLSVNPVQPGDTTVNGAIGAGGYTIWVNGALASQNGGAWTAQIAPVGVRGGLVTVTAIPNSGPRVNAQATVQAPQGVFISQYRHNQQTDDRIRWNGALTWQHSSDVMNWEDGGGGTDTSSFYEDYPFYTPALVQTNWPATGWPQPLTNGVETSTIWNNLVTPPIVTSNTFIADPPALPQEHCDTSQTPCGGPNVRRTADTELKLATGGPLGSRQMNLWCLSASALDVDTGLLIPPEQIEIGGFGYQDANAELWVQLPDNDPPQVTPKTKWKKNYSFSVGVNQYIQQIVANGLPLSDKYVWAGRDFCVGQAIYFNVTGLPPRFYEAVAVWSVPGTFVNRQPDPNCLAYYDQDPALRTRSTLTNGALTTYAWYVKDLQPATVSVEVRFRVTQTGRWYTNNLSGKFNVHRPTATFIPPSSLDGTPTPMVTGGWLTLGWNRSQDMSFGYQINPGGFAGQSGFTQLASGEYTSSTTGLPVGISTNGLALDNGEFFRGIASVPTNTSTAVTFWDGPRDHLYPQTAGAKMDVDYFAYLLFKPNDGPGPNIFVPLCLVTWELHDEAANNVIVTPYVIKGPDPSDSTAFPRWTSVFINP